MLLLEKAQKHLQRPQFFPTLLGRDLPRNADRDIALHQGTKKQRNVSKSKQMRIIGSGDLGAWNLAEVPDLFLNLLTRIRSRLHKVHSLSEHMIVGTAGEVPLV